MNLVLLFQWKPLSVILVMIAIRDHVSTRSALTPTAKNAKRICSAVDHFLILVVTARRDLWPIGAAWHENEKVIYTCSCVVFAVKNIFKRRKTTRQKTVVLDDNAYIVERECIFTNLVNNFCNIIYQGDEHECTSCKTDLCNSAGHLPVNSVLMAVVTCLYLFRSKIVT